MAACGWVVDRCGCGTGCWDNYSPATRAQASALAIAFMYAATGRQFGLCPVTVMPCNPSPAPALYETFPVVHRNGWGTAGGGSGLATPSLEGGRWFNRCGGGCSCASKCEVRLDGRVNAITQVIVDGEPLDPRAYQVHDEGLLVRIDGGCWPTCQSFDTEFPGFEVSYLRGVAVPAGVQAGLEVLTCEYAKACTGKACGLPARVAALSRQGVDVTVAQIDQTRPGELRTGIAAVDDAITAVNPFGRMQAPQVFSPDLAPPARTVTWQATS